jgi:Na+-transporting methylmalonyl-CoA/oxaloacetate decarboxylase gamma subunit
MKRFTRLSQCLLVLVCFLLSAAVCRADIGPRRPLPPSKVEPKTAEAVDFVMSTKYAPEEGYELLIPESILQKSARSTVGGTIDNLRIPIAGVAIALAVLSVLVLVRRRTASTVVSKAAVASLLIAVLLFSALPFATGDLLPPEPRPVKDKITVKIVKDAEAVELIRYQRPSRNRGGREPQAEPRALPFDGAASAE